MGSFGGSPRTDLPVIRRSRAVRFPSTQESTRARAVVGGIGAPLVPTVVSGVAGQQAEEAASVRSHVDAPVCNRRLERDGLAERDLPQHIAGPFRERVDLARGSPNEHLAVHHGGRRQDIVVSCSFPWLMQIAGPDHLAGLRIDAPGVGAHRAVTSNLPDCAWQGGGGSARVVGAMLEPKVY